MNNYNMRKIVITILFLTQLAALNCSSQNINNNQPKEFAVWTLTKGVLKLKLKQYTNKDRQDIWVNIYAAYSEQSSPNARFDLEKNKIKILDLVKIRFKNTSYAEFSDKSGQSNLKNKFFKSFKKT